MTKNHQHQYWNNSSSNNNKMRQMTKESITSNHSAQKLKSPSQNHLQLGGRNDYLLMFVERRINDFLFYHKKSVLMCYKNNTHVVAILLLLLLLFAATSTILLLLFSSTRCFANSTSASKPRSTCRDDVESESSSLTLSVASL